MPFPSSALFHKQPNQGSSSEAQADHQTVVQFERNYEIGRILLIPPTPTAIRELLPTWRGRTEGEKRQRRLGGGGVQLSPPSPAFSAEMRREEERGCSRRSWCLSKSGRGLSTLLILHGFQYLVRSSCLKPWPAGSAFGGAGLSRLIFVLPSSMRPSWREDRPSRLSWSACQLRQQAVVRADPGPPSGSCRY